MEQTTFRFKARPVEGESLNAFRLRQGELTTRVKSEPHRLEPQKLLCDLLKRESRRVMADVTRCPADTVPAHLARLETLCDISEHLMRHDLKHTPESRLSGRQLAYPTTLADFVACMEITRKSHRCPEFINPAHDQFEQIMHMLQTIAFFQSQITPNILNTEEN